MTGNETHTMSMSIHMETSTKANEGAIAAPPPPDPTYTLRPHAGGVTSLKYIHLGTRGGLLTGTSVGRLGLWDLSTKRQLWTERLERPVISVDTADSSGKLVSQCRGGVVDVWNIETKRKEMTFSIDNPGFCRLSLLHDGTPSGLSFAVAASTYGKVNLYDVLSSQLSATLSAKDPKSTGTCMCTRIFSCAGSNATCVLGGFEDGSVVVWDCRKTSEELASVKLFPEPVMCLAYDIARSCGVCGSPLNTLESFTFTKEEEALKKRYSIEIKNPGVADVDVRKDGRIFASGGWDGRIRVFGWKKGKPLAILNYHTATVNCVGFVHTSNCPEEDCNLLACGSKDERISLWKLY